MLASGTPLGVTPLASHGGVGYVGALPLLAALAIAQDGEVVNGVVRQMPRAGIAIAATYPPSVPLGVVISLPAVTGAAAPRAGEQFAPFVFPRLAAFAEALPPLLLLDRVMAMPRAGNAVAAAYAPALSLGVNAAFDPVLAQASIFIDGEVRQTDIAITMPAAAARIAMMMPPRINGAGPFFFPRRRAFASTGAPALPFDMVLALPRLDALAALQQDGDLSEPDEALFFIVS